MKKNNITPYFSHDITIKKLLKSGISSPAEKNFQKIEKFLGILSDF